MATLEVKNIAGETVGSIELADAVFSVEVKEHLFWEVVRAQRAGWRAGTASTKDRSEVRGGGKKPYRQKGTGRARQGSATAPNHVGGGIVFGPRPRKYKLHLPKQVRRQALCSALSLRVQEQRLVVIDSLALPEIKTKALAATLARLGSSRALIVEQPENEKLVLSARNLARCKVLPPEGVNVYDILDHEQLILTKDTARALEQRLAPA